MSGTKSAIVPSATKSSSGFKSNSAAPGRLISRPRFKNGVREFESKTGGAKFAKF